MGALVTGDELRELVLAHTVRSRRYGPRLYADGEPEIGSAQYEALGYHERVALAERRCGIWRADPTIDLGAAPTVRPLYQRNPDVWKDI
jgi:hypothetical protein